MKKEEFTGSFTPSHHAKLFGLIAKEVINDFGEDGKEVIRKGVIRYGEQRGRRMAMRVKADGFDLSPPNYLAYGEWEDTTGQLDFRFPESSSDLHMEGHQCPWYIEWEKNNQLNYAILYCKDIDAALVRGYNPEIKFEVKGTRTEGAPLCDFWFRKANMTEEDNQLLQERKLKLGKKAKMPWDYHMGHIYKTLKEVVVLHFKKEGQEAIDRALDNFANEFGKEALEIIKKYEDTDFNQLPDYPGING